MGSRTPANRRTVLVALVAVGLALLLGLPASALAATPSVSTTDAASTSATAATIEGLVNPAQESTTYAVEYDLGSSTWCTNNGSTGTPAQTTAATPLGFADSSSHLVSVDLTGLTAGAAYCAQVVATNGDGKSDGGQVTWTQGVPAAVTYGASPTSATAASLSGNVNPAGQDTTIAVEYDLESSTWCQNNGASGSPAGTTTGTDLGFTDDNGHDASVDLTGLTSGADYCAELVASNSSGSSAVTTPVKWTQGTPSADTYGATSTSGTAATVGGDVNPAGQDTTYVVEYDLESSNWCVTGGFSGTAGNTTTAVDLGFTDASFHDVSADLTGLTPGARYCAEVVATNGSGTSPAGFVAEWTQGVPSVETFSSTPTSGTTAEVEGAVNPVGQDTSYQVAWDVESSSWCQSFGFASAPAHRTTLENLGFADDTAHNVAASLTGLTSGTVYCSAIVAVNASGTVTGVPESWTQGTPVVRTTSGLSTGTSTATVKGLIQPSDEDTTYEVQYDDSGSTWCQTGGGSGAPGNTTTATDLGFTDHTSHQVSVDLSGLTPGTSYCAELLATNAAGSASGGQVTWLEGSPGVETSGALSTGTTTATITGQVDPSSLSTTYEAVYDLAGSTWCETAGASGAPANSTTATNVGSTDTAFHAVSIDLTGLTEAASYCVAIEATNGAGTVDGAQVGWIQGAPTVDTTGASSTGLTTATVTGDVNPSGQTTAYQVEYGPADSSWCTSGGFAGAPGATSTAVDLGFSDGVSHAVSVDLSGLTPRQAYCGALVAANPDGSGTGAQETWTQPAPPQHTLTVSLAGSGAGSVSSAPAGIDCGATCSQDFDEGTVVTLSETPGADSVFAGWSGGGCSGTGTCSVTMSGDQAVTAIFSPAPHLLTVQVSGSGSGSVSSSPAGIDCGSTCTHVFDQGTPITLTATPAAGSAFAGFSGATCVASGVDACQVTLGGSDETLTATFVTATVTMHTLTVDKAGTGSGSVTSSTAGIDCGSACSHAYADSASVSLSATAGSGSTFAGWSGAGCSGTKICIVPMSADATVTATFTSSSGGGSGAGGSSACTVPRVTGHTLSVAKRAIAKAHCRVGTVKKAHSAKVKRGKVVSERPRAGKKLAADSKVNLVLSKGRKKH